MCSLKFRRRTLKLDSYSCTPYRSHSLFAFKIQGSRQADFLRDYIRFVKSTCCKELETEKRTLQEQFNVQKFSYYRHLKVSVGNAGDLFMPGLSLDTTYMNDVPYSDQIQLRFVKVFPESDKLESSVFTSPLKHGRVVSLVKESPSESLFQTYKRSDRTLDWRSVSGVISKIESTSDRICVYVDINFDFDCNHFISQSFNKKDCQDDVNMFSKSHVRALIGAFRRLVNVLEYKDDVLIERGSKLFHKINHSPIFRKRLTTHSIVKKLSIPNASLSLLNDDVSKLEAFNKAFNLPLSVIHGPPGTGKTACLATVIFGLLNFCNKILVVAPSHAACDAIALALLDQQSGSELYQNSDIVRIAKPSRVTNPRILPLLPILSSGNESTREDRQECLNSSEKLYSVNVKILLGQFSSSKLESLHKSRNEALAEYRKHRGKLDKKALKMSKVVVCTLSTANEMLMDHKNGSRKFEGLCVDEAAFVNDHDLLPLLLSNNHFKRVVLSGDHFQLPPVIKGFENKQQVHEDFQKSEVTLFERLCCDDSNEKDSLLTTLETQYRSSELIMRWSRDKFYKGKLISDDSVAHSKLSDLPDVNDKQSTGLADFNLKWIDTPNHLEEFHDSSWSSTADPHASSTSFHNIGEARIVAKLVEEYLQCGMKSHEIGVITPYWAQVSLIRSILLLNNERKKFSDHSQIPVVSTVDGFQGGERELVIISLVRSSPLADDDLTSSVGFLSDLRRLNVALTRARKCCIVVGNSSTLGSSGSGEIGSLIEFCKRHAVFVSSTHSM